MAHNPITIDVLKTLDAIDQRGSFAAAAQAMHKVPSALTYTIQKAEQDLNMSLFDRSGHRAKLTDAGALILKQGRFILRDLNNLANTAKMLAAGWETQLTLCVDTLFDSQKLLPCIKEFHAQFPFINVNVTRGSLTGTWEQLLNRSADIAITMEADKTIMDDYYTRELGNVELALMASKEHPLAQHTTPVSDELIEQYPVINIPDSSKIITPVTFGWTRSSQSISVGSMHDKIEAIKLGLGIGHLPTHRVKMELENNELIYLKDTTMVGKGLIAWRQEKITPGIQWFLDKIQLETLCPH